MSGPHKFVFFLTTPFGGGVHRGDPMGSPYAHMSTPYGGTHTGPLRGPVSGSFFFSYRTVSLRLPGSYTNPQRGWYRTPKGSGNATFSVRTRVRNNFGHFSRHLGQNCRLVSFSTGTLRGLLTPSGPLDPFGAHPSGVINQPPKGLVKGKNNILIENKSKPQFTPN